MSRRAYRRFKEIQDEEALINLMPLIDVVFVVLVMFIVIAPMIDVDKVSLAEGVTEVKNSDMKKDLSIYVHADNTIWVDKRQVSLEDLLYLLKAHHERSNESTFQVYHDEAASFGTYQKVRMVGQKAGFEHMDVILKPDTL